MQVLEFLQENWRWIASIGLAFITLLVTMFRKKTKVIDSALIDTLKIMPDLIDKAESLFSSGADKKAYVISSAIGYYLDAGGLSKTDALVDILSSFTEAILTTPTKKVR